MQPSQFFSPESFYSLAGASAAVFVVSNTLQSAFNFNPKWLALLLAEVIAVYGMFASHSANVSTDYLIAILNGCLIYCTVVGGTAVGSSTNKLGTPRALVGHQETRRRFLSPWF